jgi:TRAP-type C4-dicarboxylate transport system permease small subunit
MRSVPESRAEPRSGEPSAAGQAGAPAARRRLYQGPPAPWPLAVLGAAIDWAIIAIGGVMVALVFANVLFRFFGGDIALTTELCEFLMVWVTFLGGAAAMRRGLHMTITEFLDKLGPDRRRWADAAIGVLSIAILALLVWHGIGIVNSGWGNELTVLHIPLALQYLALPVGAGAMAVFAAWDLVLVVRGHTREQRFGAG